MARPTPRLDAIVAALTDAEGTLSPNDIAKKSGLTPANVQAGLKALEEKGKVVREGTGEYRLWRQTDHLPTPPLPGGGPASFAYLEEGATAVPSDVWFVIDLPGGGALHVPVSVLADARRVGPPARATGRAVGNAPPQTGAGATRAGQRQRA